MKGHNCERCVFYDYTTRTVYDGEVSEVVKDHFCKGNPIPATMLEFGCGLWQEGKI